MKPYVKYENKCSININKDYGKVLPENVLIITKLRISVNLIRIIREQCRAIR